MYRRFCNPAFVRGAISGNSYFRSPFHFLKVCKKRLPSLLPVKSIASSCATTETITTLDQNNISDFIDRFDNFLLDCDGVLWGADHYTKFRFTAETIHLLRNIGKNVIFVTNNSMRSRSELLEKFSDYGGFDAPLEKIFAATSVAALYLKDILKASGKCYVIGGSGLEKELRDCGFEVFGVGVDTDQVSEEMDVLLNQRFETDVCAVVVGFDPHFCYSKMFKAACYLTNPDCHFIATSNLEGSVWIGTNRLQPVTGAIVDAVAMGAEREPVIVGKPYTQLWDSIKSQFPQLEVSRTVFIGDTTKTDVHFANNLGMSSVLVLTGADGLDTVKKHVEKEEYLNVPKYILPKFCNIAGHF